MKFVVFPEVDAEIKGGISVTHSFIQSVQGIDFASAVLIWNFSTKSRVHLWPLTFHLQTEESFPL